MVRVRREIGGYVAVAAVVSLLAFTSFAADTSAQISEVGGAIEGTVSDTSQAVVPNVEVRIRNTLTNQTRSVTTDGHGFFRASQLAVGTYETHLDQSGFAPYDVRISP